MVNGANKDVTILELIELLNVKLELQKYHVVKIFRKLILLCAVYRRLADEDDELSEVQPDAVPPEVREWLASTFTRQLATAKRKSDEKPKFRSVAHAIRAGIFVDRIYRRVTSTALMQFPQDVIRVLKVSLNIKKIVGIHGEEAELFSIELICGS